MNWREITNAFLYQPDHPLLFHQGFFLFIFSVFLVVYSFFYKRKEISQFLIIGFSAYFYCKASGIFILLLLLTITIDYFFSYLFIQTKTNWKRKLLLITSILFSLSFLIYFKYKNFFIQNLNSVTGSEFPITELILPIGISFYTFQSISYLVDVYHRKIERPPFYQYLMYMLFFPHLVAGPIVRAKDFLPQLKKNPSISKLEWNEAMYLILKGFIKKAIIADYIAQYADNVFSMPMAFSGSEHILGSICYTLQIFCDFSGYTDMAIGIALLLGYRLEINFNSPYKSVNITEFWRRWHISLSSWLKDYLYISMGGNRKGLPLQLLFLFLTMLIGGLWHGADWKFVFWGAAHGLLLILHKLWIKHFNDRFNHQVFHVFSLILTFFAVNLLWIPFRANSMEDTWIIYQKIATNGEWENVKNVMINNPMLGLFLLLGYAATLLSTSWKSGIVQLFNKQNMVLKILLFVVVIQLFLQMKSSVVQPFIYFQF